MQDKEQIYELAMQTIKSKRPLFIDELISYLPITRATFYSYYPLESDKLNNIKEAINHCKIELKASMRNKWYKSENPTLQVSLMKLLANNEEREALMMSASTVDNSVTIKVERVD